MCSAMTKKTLEEISKATGVKLTLGRLIWAIRKADDIPQIIFAEKLHYPKEQFIRLCLQDMVDRDKLNVVVDVWPRGKEKRVQKQLAFA